MLKTFGKFFAVVFFGVFEHDSVAARARVAPGGPVGIQVNLHVEAVFRSLLESSGVLVLAPCERAVLGCLEHLSKPYIERLAHLDRSAH